MVRTSPSRRLAALASSGWGRSLGWLRAIRREQGQTLVEYALIIGFVAMGLVLALGTMSDAISGLINSAANTITSAVNGG